MDVIIRKHSDDYSTAMNSSKARPRYKTSAIDEAKGV